MSEEPNFTTIRSAVQLPVAPGCVTNLFLTDALKARQYAARTGRQVFWIEEAQMAVWFQPLRRESDLAPA